eukprot:COSAG04_NODE_254_length_18809_cov_8.025869_26_plen_564_part_00
MAVFFGDEQAEGWVGAAVLLVGMLIGCGGCLFAGCKVYKSDPFDYFNDDEPRTLSLCCALICVPLILVSALCAYVFFEGEHVDNNYANKSMPIGGPGSGSGPDDPQYFDCHQRTSGLYPAYLVTALCVVLTPLYAALDPELGWERWRLKDKWVERNTEAEAKLRAEVINKMPEAAVPLGEQAEALWQWAEGTADEDGKRWLSPKEITQMADFAVMERDALCELLGSVESGPTCGPRAMLGGRVGTVIRVGSDNRDDEKGQIQVRWEDDGTKSPWVGGKDAIKVSDLDEPLGEGSAVRHNGRRGTAAAEPGTDSAYINHNAIQIRWEDDGTVSDWINVSEMDVEVSVGREDFVAACTQHPERTAKMHPWALYFTVPRLKEKADAALLEAKIAAVWRWADTVADGELNATELRRLADRVYSNHQPGWRGSSSSEKRFQDVCGALGLPQLETSAAVLGGRIGAVIQVRWEDEGKIQVQWDDDGTESPWASSENDWKMPDDAIKVSELDEPLGACVSIDEETFAFRCREQNLDGRGRRGVEWWFERLELPLVEERSCLDDLCLCCGL